MKCKFIKLFFIFLFINGKIFCQTPAQTIPDFTFYNLDKTPFTQKNINLTKKVFFMFFDATCDHCQQAMAYIGEHYSVFKKVTMYLVTLDDIGTMNSFMAKYGAKLKDKKNVTLLHDKQNMFITKFMPRKYPSMLLYSTQKKLLNYEDSDEGVINFFKFINTK